MQNYYIDLGLNPDASANDIKIAYRKKSFDNHPDRVAGGLATYKRVQQAYSVLIDPTSKMIYDNEEEIKAWRDVWINEKITKLIAEEELKKSKDEEIDFLKKKLEELTEENEILKLKEEFVVI